MSYALIDITMVTIVLFVTVYYINSIQLVYIFYSITKLCRHCIIVTLSIRYHDYTISA